VREFIAGKGRADTFTCAARDVAEGIQRHVQGFTDDVRQEPGLQRNAAVVLGNVGTADDAAALKR